MSESFRRAVFGTLAAIAIVVVAYVLSDAMMNQASSLENFFFIVLSVSIPLVIALVVPVHVICTRLSYTSVYHYIAAGFLAISIYMVFGVQKVVQAGAGMSGVSGKVVGARSVGMRNAPESVLDAPREVTPSFNFASFMQDMSFAVFLVQIKIYALTALVMYAFWWIAVKDKKA